MISMSRIGFRLAWQPSCSPLAAIVREPMSWRMALFRRAEPGQEPTLSPRLAARWGYLQYIGIVIGLPTLPGCQRLAAISDGMVAAVVTTPGRRHHPWWGRDKYRSFLFYFIPYHYGSMQPAGQRSNCLCSSAILLVGTRHAEAPRNFAMALPPIASPGAQRELRC